MSTKLFAQCFGCKKTKFIVRNRTVILPTGLSVLSQKLFCRACGDKLKAALVSKS